MGVLPRPARRNRTGAPMPDFDDYCPSMQSSPSTCPPADLAIRSQRQLDSPPGARANYDASFGGALPDRLRAPSVAPPMGSSSASTEQASSPGRRVTVRRAHHQRTADEVAGTVPPGCGTTSPVAGALHGRENNRHVGNRVLEAGSDERQQRPPGTCTSPSLRCAPSSPRHTNALLTARQNS